MPKFQCKSKLHFIRVIHVYLKGTPIADLKIAIIYWICACDVYKKLAYLKNLTRVNNSRTLRIKNAKFSGYCFLMNTNIA